MTECYVFALEFSLFAAEIFYMDVFLWQKSSNRFLTKIILAKGFLTKDFRRISTGKMFL